MLHCFNGSLSKWKGIVTEAPLKAALKLWHLLNVLFLLSVRLQLKYYVNPGLTSAE